MENPASEPVLQSNHTKEIDKLAFIYIRDRKILSSRTRGRTVWYIPGGKREAGENDIEALTREIREELNISLNISDLKYLGVFKAQADYHKQGTVVKMSCYSCSFSGEIYPAQEVEEVAYLTYSERDKSSPVDQLIFQYLYDAGLID